MVQSNRPKPSSRSRANSERLRALQDNGVRANPSEIAALADLPWLSASHRCRRSNPLDPKQSWRSHPSHFEQTSRNRGGQFSAEKMIFEVTKPVMTGGGGRIFPPVEVRRPLKPAENFYSVQIFQSSSPLVLVATRTNGNGD